MPSRKTAVLLRIDSSFKATVQNLYVVSAQVPALDLGQALKKDGEAVFRIAKEFALDQAFDELQVVELEDILRMVRFICWMISGHASGHASDPASHEEPATKMNTQLLRQLLASIVLQTQAQQHSFESLLKTFGIDRQLAGQLPPPSDRKSEPTRRPSVSVNLQRTDRTSETRVYIRPNEVEISTIVNESIWTANATRNHGK